MSDEEAIETLTLLLHELSITGSLIFSALKPLVAALKAGRSPQAMGLSHELQNPKEWLQSIQHILQEATQVYQKIPAGLKEASVPEELKFWSGFMANAKGLLKKLELMKDGTQMSSVAFMPIDEAFQQLEVMSLAP